jgi:hypothetical protein
VTAARGLTAEVQVLPAIACGAYGDRRALARAAQAAVGPPSPTRKAHTPSDFLRKSSSSMSRASAAPSRATR